MRFVAGTGERVRIVHGHVHDRPGIFPLALVQPGKNHCANVARADERRALWMDDRRRNVFGDASIQAAAELAVPDSVSEVNAQTDSEPDEEPDPCFDRQTKHQDQTGDDAEDREPWIHRDPKWS